MKERHLMLRSLPGLLALVAGLWVSIFPQQAWSDDRSLLREFAREPFVFILFDTSGSMHWAPKCTQEQFDAGNCSLLCPTGDCFVPLNSDDPNSKFYQAKEALHQVLETVDGVHFGFGTYNQDERNQTYCRVSAKFITCPCLMPR